MALAEKIAAQRPEAVYLRRGRAIQKTEFKYGWQDESLERRSGVRDERAGRINMSPRTARNVLGSKIP
jgi:hypothetical protein